jgi:hypothetical protein
MKLEEINEIEDKSERLRLLTEFVEQVLETQRGKAEIAADEEMNATRDEAHGMMSRYGKPGDD